MNKFKLFADLLIFKKEIVNQKLHILCSVREQQVAKKGWLMQCQTLVPKQFFVVTLFVLNNKEVNHHLKFRWDQWKSYTHINAEIVNRKSISKEKIKIPVSLVKLDIKASDLHQVRIPRFMLESLYYITCDMIQMLDVLSIAVRETKHFCIHNLK